MHKSIQNEYPSNPQIAQIMPMATESVESVYSADEIQTSADFKLADWIILV